MAKEERVHRVADRIRDEVSAIIARDLRDPRAGFITITKVWLSRDLRHAKIMYSTIGTPEEKKASQETLERASGFIRREIGRRISLRSTPEIVFEFDSSIEEGMKIERILKEIKESES